MKDLPCNTGPAELAAVIEETLRQIAAPPRPYRRGPKERKPMSNGRGKLAPFVAEIVARAAAGETVKELAVAYKCTAPSILNILKKRKAA